MSRLKDEFLATLSHELRTPLNAIQGWSELLRQAGTKPEDVDRGLEAISRNVRIQAQIVNDLLDMSRVVSGRKRAGTPISQ
jgi:signal transduction histidine kinase